MYSTDAYVTKTKDGYRIEGDCWGWGKVDAKTKYFVDVVGVASDSTDSMRLERLADGKDLYWFPTPYTGGDVDCGWWYQVVASDGSDHLGNRIATDGGCWVRTVLWKWVDQGNMNYAASVADDNWYWAPLLP